MIVDIVGPLLTIFNLVVLLICAVAYYRLAEEEQIAGWIWALPSAVMYLITWLVIHCGITGNLVGQGLLLLLIGVFRAAKELLRR